MEDADESVDISVVGSPHADRAASGSILGGAAANGNGFLQGYEHVPAVPCTAQEGVVQDVVVSDDTSAGEPFHCASAPDLHQWLILPCRLSNPWYTPQCSGFISCDGSRGVVSSRVTDPLLAKLQ